MRRVVSMWSAISSAVGGFVLLPSTGLTSRLGTGCVGRAR